MPSFGTTVVREMEQRRRLREVLLESTLAPRGDHNRAGLQAQLDRVEANLVIAEAQVVAAENAFNAAWCTSTESAPE